MITITNNSQESSISVKTMADAKRVLKKVKKIYGRDSLKDLTLYIPKNKGPYSGTYYAIDIEL